MAINKNPEEIEEAFDHYAKVLEEHGCRVEDSRVYLTDRCRDFVRKEIDGMESLASFVGNPFKFYIDAVRETLKPVKYEKE